MRDQPPGLDIDAVIDRLCAVGMCLDLRAHGGPVYLDATRHGLPLRQIVAADGRPNYLACALRELVALAGEHDEIVLLYDAGLEADYLLLHRVLTRLGADGPSGRARPGADRRPDPSARHGDWRGHTAGALRAALGQEHGQAAVRLGLRLYFIAVLGQAPATSSAGRCCGAGFDAPNGCWMAEPEAAVWARRDVLARHARRPRLRRPVPARLQPARPARARSGTRTTRGGVHMTLTQEVLRSQVAQRIRVALPDLGPLPGRPGRHAAGGGRRRRPDGGRGVCCDDSTWRR